MKLFKYTARDAQNAYIVLDKITNFTHHYDTVDIYLVGSTQNEPDITLYGGLDILAFFNTLGVRGGKLTRMMQHSRYADMIAEPLVTKPPRAQPEGFSWDKKRPTTEPLDTG